MAIWMPPHCLRGIPVVLDCLVAMVAQEARPVPKQARVALVVQDRLVAQVLELAVLALERHTTPVHTEDISFRVAAVAEATVAAAVNQPRTLTITTINTMNMEMVAREARLASSLSVLANATTEKG